MARPLYILGAGGLAREMAQLARIVDPNGSRWAFEGFVGGGLGEIGKDLGFGLVVGDDDWFLRSGITSDVIVGVGHPNVRQRVAQRYVAASDRFQFPNLIHPTAQVDERYVALGIGNVITAGCIFTCDIRVGDFNLFNWSVTVGHDAVIGSWCVINPSVNVSGGAQVGDAVLVGTGAQVLENRRIGAMATVGAGAVVTHDADPGVTVVGIPARPSESQRRPS